MVSSGLLTGDWNVQALHGARFTPYLPVKLQLVGNGPDRNITTVSRLKPLPVDRPIGPQLPGIRIDWGSWTTPAVDGEGFDENVFTRMVQTWYAAAECELNTVCGHAGVEGETASMGIGRVSKEHRTTVRGRFRDVADELGVIGHRLAWTVKWLRTAQAYASSAGAAGVDRQQARTLLGASRKAAVFAAEKWHCADDADTVQALRDGIRWMATIGRARKESPPLIIRLVVGAAATEIKRAVELAERAEVELFALASRRQRRALQEARAWAASASKSAGHKATKTAVPVMAATASAWKTHFGETTLQRAADCGIVEWSVPWQAADDDGGSDILAAIEAVECTVQREPDIALPVINGLRIHDVGKRFRGSTGVGRDWLRPRHVVMMSRAAAHVLAGILMAIERVRRWP